MSNEKDVEGAIVGSLNASVAEALRHKLDSHRDVEATLRAWIASNLPARSQELHDTAKNIHFLLKSGEILCECDLLLPLIFSPCKSFSSHSVNNY